MISFGSASRTNPRRNGRKTIAVALDYMVAFGDGFEAELRRSLELHCQSLDLNVLLFYGRALEGPSNAAHNTIFELIHPEYVDGLIVVSTSLAAECGVAGMQRFVERFRDLSICSLGVALPSVPSVVLDNRPGMAAVIEHVLTEHDCRHVAFIGGHPGNPEAQLRLSVYHEVLAKYHLEFDPNLLACGHFMKSGGRAAMDEILNRGVVVDAVVAANDTMAIGAIESLRERGYHVPGDVPVTGFDDLKLSRLSNPALTTAAQPFAAMTRAALQVVLEQIEGRAVPDCMALPCELVVRRSCGCNPVICEDGYGSTANATLSPQARLRARSPDVRRALANSLRRDRDDGLREADQMVTALEQALQGQPEAFHFALEGMLESAGAENERYRALHNAIIYMRQELRPFATVDLEALWCDALSLIAMANTTAQVEYRLQIDASYARLLLIGERVSLALDIPSLKHELVRSLPEAGFKTVFLSRYVAGGTAELETFVSLLDGESRDAAAPAFPAHRLIPEDLLAHQQRYSLVVFPLAFETQSLGVAVFEYLPQINGYPLVRDQISAALRSVLLHEEVVAKTMLHERSVQERVVAAQRLQTLSVLAGGVAHDLNNALGPLVALPDVIQQELAEFEAEHGSAPDLAEDVASMKTATMRASQTIKDLLTLGRQGRTARHPVDLNLVVEGCLSGDSLRFFREINPRVRVVAELSPETLVVRASDAQLSRAITNLVRNAVEAIHGSGEVRVRLFPAYLSAPIAAFETIAPGNYSVISVSDTGAGIPQERITQVFEPFFSSKRAGERSGTGLGLAIVLGVIKEHEGFVDLVSSVGVGTEFKIYLPTICEQPRRSDRVVLTGKHAAKILIVDDDPMQLRTGRRVLGRLGYAVDTLENAKHALELFANASAGGTSPYDLVILDMMLNDDWDGLLLFERIREFFPGQRAIIASGHAPNERVQYAVDQGVEWLAKPYTVKALASAVVLALDGA